MFGYLISSVQNFRFLWLMINNWITMINIFQQMNEETSRFDKTSNVRHIVCILLKHDEREGMAKSHHHTLDPIIGTLDQGPGGRLTSSTKRTNMDCGFWLHIVWFASHYVAVLLRCWDRPSHHVRPGHETPGAWRTPLLGSQNVSWVYRILLFLLEHIGLLHFSTRVISPWAR